MKPIEKKIKNGIDEVTSVNNFSDVATRQQHIVEQKFKRKTPDKKMDSSCHRNDRHTFSPSEGGLRSQRKIRRTPGSKATCVSSCSMWSPDVCNVNAMLITLPRKEILNIPSAKRRALMGCNLPVINEQNYLSCPAIEKYKVVVTVSSKLKVTHQTCLSHARDKYCIIGCFI